MRVPTAVHTLLHIYICTFLSVTVPGFISGRSEVSDNSEPEIVVSTRTLPPGDNVLSEQTEQTAAGHGPRACMPRMRSRALRRRTVAAMGNQCCGQAAGPAGRGVQAAAPRAPPGMYSSPPPLPGSQFAPDSAVEAKLSTHFAAVARAPADRPAAWLEWSGGAALRAAADPGGSYASYCSQCTTVGAAVRTQVSKDLERTFPEHPRFQTAEQHAEQAAKAAAAGEPPPPPRQADCSMLPALERVLLALAARYPAAGYCQGMNYIAGQLLAHIGECGATDAEAAAGGTGDRPKHAQAAEVSTFWVLCAAVEQVNLYPPLEYSLSAPPCLASSRFAPLHELVLTS
eukprot:SAG22_NODE_349_length_11854_cov_8.087282_9_plen_343_part_00